MPSAAPAPDLPTGTVTFLFTDLEGSTRLATALGEGFPLRLAAHHAVLREAIAGHRGTTVSTEGDSFFAVFPDAADAVGAAVQAQRRLDSEAPGEPPLLVRIGLHTGQAVLGGDNYAGLDVVRAARIMAAGHGGQVLVSDATRALVENRLPAGVALRQLGTYVLKDLPRPERLHQLEIEGLRSTFPPVRARDLRGSHLPAEATTFIGREAELEALGDLLRQRRLVTLTGPGGTGKTRLALRTAAEVAERFGDGAYFVSLAATDDPAHIPVALASTFGLPEDRERSTLAVVHRWLSERDVLIVLDNLEQIDAAGPVVGDLMTAAPGLRILATSRSPLRVPGEQEYPVPAFSVPPPDAPGSALESSDAIRLFIDRARLVRPALDPDHQDLVVIAGIAQRLDGLPLAIELAAARVRLFSIAAISERLGHRLDALVAGTSHAEPRQRSLRATIAWSHDLLDPAAKALFGRLAIFSGGWSLDAAEQIAGGPPTSDVAGSMEMLASQSLVRTVEGSSVPRFEMLQTIREFALEQLDASGEAPELTARHATFYRSVADAALAGSSGPAREAWFDVLEADLDNLRTAIDRSVTAGRSEEALAIAAALSPFWLQRNHCAEGLRLLLTLVGREGVKRGTGFAAATAAAARIATWLGDYPTARWTGEESVATYRDLGDRAGLAEALGSFAFATIEVDAVTALALNRESGEIYRQLGDIRGEGQAYLGRATAQFSLGLLPEVRQSLERSLDLLRRAGDHYFAIFASIFLGRIKLLMGDIQAGFDEYRSVLERSRALDLWLGIALGLDYVGELAIWADDVRRAVRLGAVAARLKEQLGGGVPPRMGGALEPLEVGRLRLSGIGFDRELAAGRAMDLDAAIAEALAVRLPTSIPAAPLPDRAARAMG